RRGRDPGLRQRRLRRGGRARAPRARGRRRRGRGRAAGGHAPHPAIRRRRPAHGRARGIRLRRGIHRMNETIEKLGAHEVAAWLRRHPRFLQQFPDLAISLVVPREDGPAASLASYQLEVLRDKNRELSRRLQDLYAVSQENARRAVRTHQLTLALMRPGSAAGVVRAMVATLAEDFDGDIVRVVLFDPVPGLGDEEWLQVVPRDDARLRPFADCIRDGEPLCGRLHPDKQAMLYAARGDEVASTALLPTEGVGLVAVGSRDANRFYPGMGTLFLRMMGEAFAVALLRHRDD